MRFPFLFRKDVEDSYARDNFSRIADYFRSNPVDRCDFRMVEITTTGAVSNQAYNHSLGFKPEDAIITYISSGTASLNYSSFTSEYINITTSAAATIRILVGKYNG